MQIDQLMNNPGPSVFYDTDFRNVLEAHMTFLRTHPNTTQISIEPSKAYEYEYDFYGLLRLYNVPEEHHWITMRMNGMVSPSEMKEEISTLLVPNAIIINRIRQSHMSSRRVQ